MTAKPDRGQLENLIPVAGMRMPGSDPSGIPDSTGAAHGVALFYASVETQSVKPRGQRAEPLAVKQLKMKYKI